MAVAVAPSTYMEQEKQKKSHLDISAKEFYFSKVKPFMDDMALKCKTDKELLRTIDKVTNAANSFAVRDDWQNVSESFDVLQTAITDNSYFNGVMKKAPESEKEMVRELIKKIAELKMIIKCENIEEKHEENKVRKRLNYSPNGENKDYAIHNMENLSKANPRERIPNV